MGHQNAMRTKKSSTLRERLKYPIGPDQTPNATICIGLRVDGIGFRDSEAGSYLRRIEFVCPSTLGLSVIKKKKKKVWVILEKRSTPS